MKKFKELEITWGNDKFIFVSQGKSKGITPEEAIEYLRTRIPVDSPKAETKAVLWQLPEDKQRRMVFLMDIKSGMDFAAKKYGVSRADILREVKRIAPHMNLKEEE